jgi:hypothetical protein
LTLISSFTLACGGDGGAGTSTFEEAWDRPNAPGQLLADYQDVLSELPLEGSTEKKPWSDSYWPSHRGGLSWQWQGDPGVRRPSRDKLRDMTPEQIARLSPAEKYDIYMGRYDYPLTSYEERRTNSSQPEWWGLCHGWAQAAANFDEPRATTVRNADGIEIRFGSSDVKALLAFAQQYDPIQSPVTFLGLRCDVDLPASTDDPECKGVNPGSLHIVLANHIGRARQAFMADLRRTSQVWTYPISTFESSIVEETDEVYSSAAPGTVKVVEVETTLTHAGLVEPSFSAVGPANVQVERLRYRLELDADGRIIGGEWRTDRRPDFLWVQERPRFVGLFRRLGDLYEQASR